MRGMIHVLNFKICVLRRDFCAKIQESCMKEQSLRNLFVNNHSEHSAERLLACMKNGYTYDEKVLRKRFESQIVDETSATRAFVE